MYWAIRTPTRRSWGSTQKYVLAAPAQPCSPTERLSGDHFDDARRYIDPNAVLPPVTRLEREGQGCGGLNEILKGSGSVEMEFRLAIERRNWGSSKVPECRRNAGSRHGAGKDAIPFDN